MKKLLLVSTAALMLASASALAQEHDVKVKEMPAFLRGSWCGTEGGFQEIGDTNYQDYERKVACSDRLGQIVVNKNSYTGDDAYCVITRIAMAPDKTFFVDADCKAETEDKVIVSHEHSSVHLAGDTLHWNWTDELVSDKQ
jgi:hypothetical protein